MRLSSLALILALAAPDAARACSCVTVVSPETPMLSDGKPAPTMQDVEGADVVFAGEVIEMRPKPSGDPAADQFFVNGSVTRFRVTRYWNNRVGREVTVETGFPGGGCGFVFEKGKQYLVFAKKDTKQILTTSICTRTTSMVRVPDVWKAMIRAAGQGRIPIDQ
jgi:hypothetical protein